LALLAFELFLEAVKSLLFTVEWFSFFHKDVLTDSHMLEYDIFIEFSIAESAFYSINVIWLIIFKNCWFLGRDFSAIRFYFTRLFLSIDTYWDLRLWEILYDVIFLGGVFYLVFFFCFNIRGSRHSANVLRVCFYLNWCVGNFLISTFWKLKRCLTSLTLFFRWDFEFCFQRLQRPFLWLIPAFFTWI
jgi:hypothetical protein